jgi:hypothetical protein
MDEIPARNISHNTDSEDQSPSHVMHVGELAPAELIEAETHKQTAHSEANSSNDEEAVLRRAAAELAERKAELRALATLSSAKNEESSVETITASLQDPSATVRAAAVRALYAHNPDFATSFLNSAIRDSAPEERRTLGTAIVDSGLLEEDQSTTPDDRGFYSALSVLFLLAKTGEVASLINVIRNHSSLNLRLALINTLAASKAPDVSPAFQQLLLDPSLPKEIRSAAMEAVLQFVENE